MSRPSIPEATCSVNAFSLQIIIGALILAAVAFDQRQGRRT
jgi:ribose/xylose/arabinose/galactoside ABC-type transport system permease subunit